MAQNFVIVSIPSKHLNVSYKLSQYCSMFRRVIIIIIIIIVVVVVVVVIIIIIITILFIDETL